MTDADQGWSGDDETRQLPEPSGQGSSGTRRPKLQVFTGMATTRPKPGGPWRGEAATRVRPESSTAVDPDAQPTPTPTSHATGRTTRITALLSADGRRGPLSGAVWPDYELGDLLGQGGMGAVYRARQISVDRLVALKVLPAHLANDADLRRRFEIEARASSTLASPHIVQVYHAGIHDGQVFFAMEFVAGQSLSELAKARRAAGTWFALTETLGYVAQLTEALRVAGAAGVVHRDIKPANCMVDAQGHLKLADFGIAKILGEDGGTLTGMAMGTPSYLSPEQARGEEIDQRADLYSLGIMLYELATGRLPYVGGSPDALIYQHAFTEPPLPRSLNKDISGDLQAVILKLIQKDPAARYADAKALLSDLGRITGGMAPEVAVFVGRKLGTGADAALARLGGWRRRAVWVAAAVVASAAALGGGWWWWDAYKVSLGEADRLRGRLAVLDRQEPVPAGAADELAHLARLAGDADADVQRWRADLARVLQLQEGLQRFADLAEPSHAELQATAGTLDAYERETGGQDGLAKQSRQRLEATAVEREALRRQLAELDALDVVPAARAVALAGPLTRYRRLAPSGDGDAARWGGALQRADATVAELRAGLAPLDRAAPAPTALAAATGRLERLRVLAGGEDADVLRWQRIIDAARSRHGALRSSLSRLDEGLPPGAELAAATAADLAAWQALAEAGDPELARWRARLAAAGESRTRLAAELEAVCAAAIAADRLDGVAREVDEYRRLAGTGDAAGRLWAAAVAAARDRLEGQRAVLAQLDQRPEQLTVEEQRLARGALDGLRAAGALEQAVDERWRQRLMRDESQLALLAGNLAVLEQTVDPPAQAADWLQRYERLAGADDPKARLWRLRLDRIAALRSRLAPLDQALPVPSGAAADADSLQKLVGAGDPRLMVWRGKLARCAALAAALAALDRQAPPSADAETQLAAYMGEVGREAPDARRWRARLDRITALEERLRGLRERLLPDPAAAAAVAELAKLVGEAPAVLAARARLAELAGPPRPSWAAADGVDERGRWAEAVLLGQRVRLRWIPPATVRLGSPPDEPGRDSDETQVQVELTRGFWLADGETTQAQWSAWMGGAPSWFTASDRPVERVSWQDAIACCARLAEAGAAVRLPSEAEWEHACRAGTTGAFATGTLERAAVHDRPADAGTDAVRRRLPNALGLMDMHGNVWEWCADAYAPYPGQPAPDHRTDGGAKRVVRGGSWKDAAERLRSANRQGLDPAVRSACVGFRIAITQDAWEGMR